MTSPTNDQLSDELDIANAEAHRLRGIIDDLTEHRNLLTEESEYMAALVSHLTTKPLCTIIAERATFKAFTLCDRAVRAAHSLPDFTAIPRFLWASRPRVSVKFGWAKKL